MDSETSGIPATMLVGPTGNSNGGFGNSFGGDWGWIILLLLLAGNGGWGMGGGFGGGMYEFPWLLNGQSMINANTNSGFDHAATQSTLGDIRTTIGSGFGDIQTALCGGFAGVTSAVSGAQSAITQQMYANQIAELQQMNALQSQLANCCCENRAATQDLKYTLATEACATRQNSTANTQAILDKLCALELDGYKRENDSLRSQLTAANLAASQTRQTADIQNSIISELRACPIPSQPVYGSTPIFNCGGTGCGCGA